MSRHRRARAVAIMGVATMASALVLGVLSVLASPPIELDLTLRGAAADDDLAQIELDGMTFDQVAEVIDDLVDAARDSGDRAQAALVVTPVGMRDLEIPEAKVQRTDPDDGEHAMSFRGVLAQEPGTPSIEVLATAHWEDPESTSPETAVFFRWSRSLLSHYVPFELEEVELTGTWLAVRRPADADDTEAIEVPAGLTPDTADFLADGRDSTTDDMPVLPTRLEDTDGAVSFRGMLDHDGALADTLAQIGLSNALRLDGHVSASVLRGYVCEGFPDEEEETCTEGRSGGSLRAFPLDLSASIPLTDEATGRLPDFVEPQLDWAIRIAADDSQQVELEISGGVTVTIGDHPFDLEGSISFSYDRTERTNEVTLTLAGVEVDNAFGVEWLDFEEITGTASYTSASASADDDEDPEPSESPTATPEASPEPSESPSPSPEPTEDPDDDTDSGVLAVELSATVKLGSIDPLFEDETATATFSVEHDSDGTSAQMVLTTDALISLNRILALAGAPESEIFDIGIQGLGLMLSLSPGEGSTPDKTIAVSGTVMVGWGEVEDGEEGTRATISTDVLTRFVITSDGIDGYLVEVRGSDGVTTTVGQMIGVDLGDMDVELPSFSLTVSDTDWEVDSDDLDPVTLAWTGGEDLEIDAGVRLSASVHITGPLAEAMAELGPAIDPDTPLVITGSLPLLGSEELSLAIELPEFVTPDEEEGVFRRGTLALAFGKRAITGGTEVFLELSGNATVRVATPGVPRVDPPAGGPTECPEVSGGMLDYPADCLDDLTFTVTAGITTSVTEGLTIAVTGALTTEDGWHNPFGVQGLTIQSVRLEVAVVVATAGGVNVHVGLQGSITLGHGDDADDYTLAFLFAVTPNPPWIQPLGFTFAASSFGLHHLVDLYETVSGENVDTSSLPGVWLQDVYIAFGLADNAALCIRQGFFLAGELHFGQGGMPPGPHGDVVGCDGDGNLPPTDLPPPNESCGQSDTCLAAVLIDVQLGTTLSSAVNSRLIAKGYFAPSNIGPLEFEETRLELTLSASEQKLLVQGGVSIINPLYDPSVDHESLYHLATGSFLLDITIHRLFLEAEVQLGGKDGLGAYVRGEARFQSGSGSFSLDNPTFELVVELRTEALDKLAADVAQAFQDLGTAVEEFGPIAEQAVNDTSADIEQLFVDLGRAIDNVASDVEAAAVNAVLGTIVDARSWINEINVLIREANKLLDLDLALIDADAVLDIALHGWDGPRIDVRVPGIVWADGACSFVRVGGECYLLHYSLDISFPGLCSGAAFASHAVCVKGKLNDAVAQIATAEFSALAEDTGLDLAAVGGAVTAATTEFATASSATTLTAQDILISLNEEFAGAGVVAGCATTTLVVDGDGGTQTPLDIGLDANGAATRFGSHLNLATGDFAADGQTFQNGIAQIVKDNRNGTAPEACTTPPAPPEQPPVTIALQDGAGAGATAVRKIDEGGTVWAVGTATGASTVTVNWGDGSTSTGVSVSSGAWSVSHTYKDDGDFDIVASTNRGSASVRLIVENVAPTITTTIVGPVSSWSTDCGGIAGLTCADVVEGDLVRIEVSISDPGVLDDHTVVVQWGDGTRSAPQHLAAGAPGPLVFTHHYVDGADPWTGQVLRVFADDHDRRGTSMETYLIRVHNDDPSVERVEITSITWPLLLDGCDVAPCEAGDPEAWWAEEGAVVAIEVDLHDQGSYDALTLHVDWGDGSAVTVPVSAPLTHPADEDWEASLTRTVPLQHVYLDDAGSGSATDYTITAWVEDADGGTSRVGGEAPDDNRYTIEVRNVVPIVLDVVPVSVNGVAVSDPTSFTFDETDVLDFEVTIADRGVLDSLTVDVSWGDGDHPWSIGSSSVTLSPPSDGTDACAEAPWTCHVRTTTFTHAWDDDEGGAAEPTPFDDYVIRVTATDKDGETSDPVTRTVTIHDVAPDIGVFTVTPEAPVDVTGSADAAHVENRSDVTIVLEFVDVSPWDTHVVTVDWGAGWDETTHDVADPLGPTGGTIDMRDRNDRTTRFALAAPGADGDVTRSVTLLNRYGDAGVFRITVDVLNDDTKRDGAQVVLEVHNETPEQGIDRDEAIGDGLAFETVGDRTTWFGFERSALVFHNDATDIGSDDLIFDWWTADHTWTTEPPGRFRQLLSAPARWLSSTGDFGTGTMDPAPSPQVGPSAARHTLTASWDEACLYGVAAEVADDDGASAATDSVPVVIQRQREAADQASSDGNWQAAAKPRNFGQWKDAIESGEVSQSTLDCYLDIAGHLSSVLLGWSDRTGAPWASNDGFVDATLRDGLLPALFAEPPGRGRSRLDSERFLLDRALLSALMNLADGGYRWDTALEPGKPFWQTIAEVEQVRRTSTNVKEVADARRRLWIIGVG